MEPITIGLIAYEVIKGMCTKRVENGVDSILNSINPEEIKKRKYNHDLTRAVLIACKESELEILKSFEKSGNVKLQNFVKEQIEDIKAQINDIEHRRNHNLDMSNESLINMITTQDYDTAELGFLCEGREEFPELTKRLKEDFYSVAKIRFSYQIKKNQEISNIFNAEVISNMSHVVNELYNTLVGQYTDIKGELETIKAGTDQLRDGQTKIANDTADIKISLAEIITIITGEDRAKPKSPDTDDRKGMTGNSFALSERYGNWAYIDSVREKQKDKVSSKSVREFLCGKNCTWSLAFSDCIVHRDIVDKMMNLAKEGGITVLVGAGGEGKTTALMQMSVGLYREGYTVLYNADPEDFKLPKDLPSNTVLVVDNPPDSKQFKSFINLACQDELTVILSSRFNEWNLLKENQRISTQDITEYSMPQIKSRAEAEKLADCVMQNLNMTRSKDEIMDLFMDNAYGFLYAAMLMLVYNDNTLDTIAESIIRELMEKEPFVLMLLAHIVYSEHLGNSFSIEQYNNVCDKFGIKPGKAKDALALEVNKNGNIYVTRHSMISGLFYKLLFGEESLLKVNVAEEIRSDIFRYYLSVCADKIKDWDEKKQAEKNILRFIACITNNSTDEQYYMRLIIDEFRLNYPFLVKVQNQIPIQELRRYFLRQCFESEAFDSNLIVAIAKSEFQVQNIGAYYDGTNCAREVYRRACMDYKSDSAVWYAWAQMEQELGEIGSYTKVFTAKWIYREACINQNAIGQVWLAWAKLEEDTGDIGSYDQENTARWIYQEACLKHEADGQVWLSWAKLEEDKGEIGSYSIEDTARWIYKEACLKHGADGQVWLAWALMEQKTGDINEKEYIPGWIYKEACMKHGADGQVWLAWARMEQEAGNTGSYQEEDTARWIYREACMNHQVNGQVWLAWAKLEQELGEIGEYTIENTARWIYREACIRQQLDGQVWLAWALMEQEAGEIGSYHEENTAKWIFREACLNHYADGTVWLAWAKLEEQDGNRSAQEDLYHARWIYETAIDKHGDFAPLYGSYAVMELHNNRPQSARSILRQSVQKSNFTLFYLTVMEILYDNIATEDPYSADRLMKIMEASIHKTNTAILCLYECHKLLGNTMEAEKYHRLLVKEKEDDYEKEGLTNYIQLCRSVIGNSSK